ncbi:GNAT family N-acetyltransferase [Cellvibrio sp. UBA7661]|uniref:GNAT family N-acetyltransferase n=1 Tax=Cellvibrio sp. UBA7661 TaxID=1946311 RepID=UPI002F350EBF
MADGFLCRAMRACDIEDVIRIQAEAYRDEIIESVEVIQTRFAQTPDTSWVVESTEGNVRGYLVGYYSHLGEVTPWGQNFSHKPSADTLYLHDLAISKSAAGYGLGQLLVTHALQEASARALVSAALVSVQNSKVFWEKLGFNEYTDLPTIQQQRLASYSGPAFYMSRRLAEI